MPIDDALAMSSGPLELWRLHRQLPGVPLFDGGAVDSWPAWSLDALRICREESSAVQAFVAHEEGKKRQRHSAKR